MLVHSPFNSLLHHHVATPRCSSPWSSSPVVPLPSTEGCGPRKYKDIMGRGRSNQRGTQWPVRNQNEPRLLSWLVFALPLSPAPLTSDSRSGLNHDVADHTTTQIAEGRDGTVPQPKAQRAKQHHERLRDDTAGQKMRHRAQQQRGWCKDDVNSPGIMQTHQGRPTRPKDDASTPRMTPTPQG